MHIEAVECMVTMPNTVSDVGELLSKAHKEEKIRARDMLRIILSSVRFLARQGLAFRKVNYSDSNLIRLLELRAEDVFQITDWLAKSRRKYVSPENQNEMLNIMATQIQRKILHKSPYITIMVDETTDCSNKEQLTFVIRSVDENFEVSEDFLGMYNLLTTTASSIVSAITDTLLRLQLPLTKVRGQCYDGCSTMTGARGGVAVKIQALEPKALFTHCYGHALNLSVSDTIKQSSILKDCLDTCYELVKLVKFSPKREAILNLIKEEIDSDAPSIRTICPTRWTVRGESLASIIANYTELQSLWERALLSTSDTDMKARIRGIESQMEKFRFLFGLLLSEMILRHTDKLSQTLQSPDLSSVEGHEVAMLTVKTLQTLRSDANFDLFWKKVEGRRSEWDVEEPQLPRRHKTPRRYEEGSSEGSFHTTVEGLYRQSYFEVIDFAVSSITDRFDQDGFRVYSNVEQLLFKASSGQNYENEFSVVCDFYEDLDKEELESQLKVFQTLCKEKMEIGERPSVKLLKKILLSLSPAQRSLLNVVILAFHILLVMPATNATSERSFSALRRIKSYLRSTMTQHRLNHLMLLHYHQDLTDLLNMQEVANDFISAKEQRSTVFAKF